MFAKTIYGDKLSCFSRARASFVGVSDVSSKNGKKQECASDAHTECMAAGVKRTPIDVIRVAGTYIYVRNHQLEMH